jgi:hypothetical protein
MIRPALRRRIAGLLGSVVFPLMVLEGCAHVVRVPLGDYVTVPERSGKAVIQTRDGRIYEFRGVSADSGRFLGRVNVQRSVVGRDGHLDQVEDIEEVRVPFSEVTSVEMRSTNVLASVLAAAAGAGLIYVLVREFAPATSSSDTTGGGGNPGDNQAPLGRRSR